MKHLTDNQQAVLAEVSMYGSPQGQGRKPSQRQIQEWTNHMNSCTQCKKGIEETVSLMRKSQNQQ